MLFHAKNCYSNAPERYVYTYIVGLVVSRTAFCFSKMIGCTQAQNSIPGICDTEQYFVHNSWSIYIPNFNFPGHKQKLSKMVSALVRYFNCTSREWQEKIRKCKGRWCQNGNCASLGKTSNHNRSQSAVMWRYVVAYLK